MKIDSTTKAAVHSFVRGKERIHVLYVGQNPYGARGGCCGHALDAEAVLRTSAFRGAPKYMYCMAEIVSEIAASGCTVDISKSSLKQAGWELSR